MGLMCRFLTWVNHCASRNCADGMYKSCTDAFTAPMMCRRACEAFVTLARNDQAIILGRAELPFPASGLGRIPTFVLADNWARASRRSLGPLALTFEILLAGSVEWPPPLEPRMGGHIGNSEFASGERRYVIPNLRRGPMLLKAAATSTL